MDIRDSNSRSLVTVCSNVLFMVLFLCDEGEYKYCGNPKFGGSINCNKVLKKAQWIADRDFQVVNKVCIQMNASQETSKKYGEFPISVNLKSPTSFVSGLPYYGYVKDFFIYLHSEENDVEVDGDGHFNNLNIDKRFNFDVQLEQFYD